VGGFPIPVGGGIGGAILLLVVFFAFQFCAGGGFDIPGSPELGGADAAPRGESGPGREGTRVEFVDAVVDDIQTTWDQDIFRPAGRTYRDTSVVLFTGRTDSGCGAASAATGPFYCPADGLVYLDLGFFRELDQRFGAPGDFAQAYVLAHEIGHHVQTLLGTNEAVQRESRENPSERNELSVRLELQADCYAGVWAASVYARGVLEPGDVDEGLAAAAAVGDDRIQQQTQGRIDPESFTHGTSEQRATWFRTGFESGDPDACDTFDADI
jgi:predicted metalloprotease